MMCDSGAIRKKLGNRWLPQLAVVGHDASAVEGRPYGGRRRRPLTGGANAGANIRISVLFLRERCQQCFRHIPFAMELLSVFISSRKSGHVIGSSQIPRRPRKKKQKEKVRTMRKEKQTRNHKETTNTHSQAQNFLLLAIF